VCRTAAGVYMYYRLDISYSNEVTDASKKINKFLNCYFINFNYIFNP
jgi:hypothetical protein